MDSYYLEDNFVENDQGMAVSVITAGVHSSLEVMLNYLSTKQQIGIIATVVLGHSSNEIGDVTILKGMFGAVVTDMRVKS